MIEISHQQARRLIRQHLDSHLPEEQWNNLQAHLETCEACRAYRSRLERTEKEVRRALKASWNVVPGPEPSLPQQVVAVRQARYMLRRKILMVSAASAVMLILFLVGGRLVRTAEPAAPLSATEVPIPTATPMPTLAVGEFRGVIAYDSTTREGGTGVFLLNPGVTSSGTTDSSSGSSAEPAPELLLDASAFNNAGAKGSAQDSDPAWSPDGEWIAFLSARGTGKKEVFVSNVAASRVVQLTDEPDITWDGPLSWSADGQWVALTGIRSQQGDQRWIYRVPVNGSGPSALEGARNGYDPEYSPSGDRLAYAFSDGTRSGVMIQHIDGGEKATTDWVDNMQSVPPAAGSGIDWSMDGTGLAYIAGAATDALDGSGSAAKGERVIAARDLNYSVSLFNDFLHHFEVADSPWPGAYRGVTWSPGGGLVYLENVDDSRAHDAPGQTTTGCWTLQVQWMGFRGSTGVPGVQATPGASTTTGPRTGFAGSSLAINGLCVESGIDRSSWTPDGQWLVVLGRTPEEMAASAPRALYVVRLPRPVNATSGQTGESRIVRMATMDGAAGMPRVRPTLRRNARPLNINPQPAQKHTVLSNSDLRLASGQVYYSRRQGNGSVIVSMSPDGTGGKTLFGSDGTNRCPGPSPDGSWVAFVSDWSAAKAEPAGSSTPASPAHPDAAPQPGGSFSARGNDIYLMDRNGSNIAQVSGQGVAPGKSPGPDAHLTPDLYGCPVWSPDGKYLAATVETPTRWYLAVFAIDNGKRSSTEPARFGPIGQPAAGLSPRWAVDGRRILLAQTNAGEPSPSILALDIPSDASVDLITRPLVGHTDWDRLAGFDVSQDGRQAAMMTYQNNADGNLARLMRFDTRLGRRFGQVQVGVDYSNQPIEDNMLSWSPMGDISLIVHNGIDARYKTTILRYASQDRRLEGEIQVEDTLYSAAWSPDGSWVIYATESGLWVANVGAVQNGSAQPVWISPEPVSDLVWK